MEALRPAFNVQLATTTDAARAIVGVSVTNRGSDQGQATPMLEQIEARTGGLPGALAADRARRLIDVAPTAPVRSRPARRTVPKL